MRARLACDGRGCPISNAVRNHFRPPRSSGFGLRFRRRRRNAGECRRRSLLDDRRHADRTGPRNPQMSRAGDCRSVAGRHPSTCDHGRSCGSRVDGRPLAASRAAPTVQTSRDRSIATPALQRGVATVSAQTYQLGAERLAAFPGALLVLALVLTFLGVIDQASFA